MRISAETVVSWSPRWTRRDLRPACDARLAWTDAQRRSFISSGWGFWKRRQGPPLVPPVEEPLGLPPAQLRRISEEERGVREARIRKSALIGPVSRDKAPIVYSAGYNIRFGGLERLHPSDAAKYSRAAQHLVSSGILREDQFVEPRDPTWDDLLAAHTEDYLCSLKSSWRVAEILEIPAIALLPAPIVQAMILRPFRLQAGGSVLAAALAKERGWAVNLGGGLHHAASYATTPGGYCVYADVGMLVEFARVALGLERVLIVDLDAHQGNGHERDFMGDGNVHIVDIYNADCDPWDHAAKAAIGTAVELRSGTTTTEYLTAVQEALQAAEFSFRPDLVVYLAGTDIVEGDPLGLLQVSRSGLLQRDRMVFNTAHRMGVPLVMLASGGYQADAGRLLATSAAELLSRERS